MAKAKSPKLHHRLSSSLFTSFQICRPKSASSMIKAPFPHPPYMLSPLNSKTLDISFPAPPPSTPSKVVPLHDCRLPSSFASSHTMHHHSSHSIDSNDDRTSVPSSRNDTKKHKKSKQPKPRRLKRYGEAESEEKKAPSPCMSESFVVVKESVDPYEDFKRSMSEMIVEKQIFEPRELEQLLMSFLSLNSRLHHKVIIEAFTEILKEVFCG